MWVGVLVEDVDVDVEVAELDDTVPVLIIASVTSPL